MENRIEVSLALNLQKYAPYKGKSFYVEIQFPCVVQDVIRQLQLPEDEPFLIAINGRLASVDTPLHPGDKVKFLPVLAGG